MVILPPGIHPDDDSNENQNGYSKWAAFIPKPRKSLQTHHANSIFVNYEHQDTSQNLFIEPKNNTRSAKAQLFSGPLVPLVLRSINWVLCLSSLILAASIAKTDKSLGYSQRPSTLLAVILCAIALVYIVYITWDEYTSKPLGLRSPTSKMRLILLDLLFIIFGSANLSLAYVQLFDSEFGCHTNNALRRAWDCEKQGALVALLTILLCAWILNFVVSTLRVVERIH